MMRCLWVLAILFGLAAQACAETGYYVLTWKNGDNPDSGITFCSQIECVQDSFGEALDCAMAWCEHEIARHPGNRTYACHEGVKSDAYRHGRCTDEGPPLRKREFPEGGVTGYFTEIYSNGDRPDSVIRFCKQFACTQGTMDDAMDCARAWCERDIVLGNPGSRTRECRQGPKSEWRARGSCNTYGNDPPRARRFPRD